LRLTLAFLLALTTACVSNGSLDISDDIELDDAASGDTADLGPAEEGLADDEPVLDCGRWDGGALAGGVYEPDAGVFFFSSSPCSVTLDVTGGSFEGWIDPQMSLRRGEAWIATIELVQNPQTDVTLERSYEVGLNGTPWSEAGLTHAVVYDTEQPDLQYTFGLWVP